MVVVSVVLPVVVVALLVELVLFHPFHQPDAQSTAATKAAIKIGSPTPTTSSAYPMALITQASLHSSTHKKPSEMLIPVVDNATLGSKVKNETSRALAMATYIAPIAAVFTIAIFVFALHMVFCKKDRANQLRNLDNKKEDVSEEDGFIKKEWSTNLSKTDSTSPIIDTPV